MKKWLLLTATALMLASCGNGTGTGNESGDAGEGKTDFPKKNIEIVAPASPGGGWDLTARTVQKVLKDNDLVDKNINVQNKPGGGGEVGWKYLQKKDSHTLAVNSGLLVTNKLLGTSQLTYEDFTPLAILATEWQSIAVAEDSPYETLEDLMKAIKEDPKGIKIGVGPALGNDDHLSLVQAADEYGINPSDLNFLVYEGGGDVVTALLGHHVDFVTTSMSEVKDQHLAGKVRILAISSDERLDELKDVPTYKEEGVDMVFPHWRGIMGPPGMSEDEIAYWDDKLGEMVQTDQWLDLLDNNDWDDYYMDSKETTKFLGEQTKLYEELVEDAGLGK
ncbi:tripartite tricarboxylate transporter substrate binding protein [Edaphobacillus lindanitolerans]|uniref:Tripartite-type tricarboxylate transporter, receptor component TctC n=1 Tax=Edaphobacillus lindanitolerans TaxID=550447 RepID=A0A1U7PIA2_9BACI|nr:tripartite tricarboxylate transporter substrate binding protein [Edaphobacillus lindanitolerans]SIT72514.1 Tripartite-type tricarboxylate transporter, receptor component TctC [Edaphobacillus lindanitolerans]